MKTMKIMTAGPTEWSGKTNFVDENNVVVGWDDSQSCCESFGYFFDKHQHSSMPAYDAKTPPDPSATELDPFRFDPAYFVETTEGASDCGGMAVFKLVAPHGDLYLHLYNSHNGYYSHGFSVSVGGQQTRTGTL